MYERKSTDENSNGEIISIAYTFKNFQARPFEWLLLSSGNELGKISGKVWNVIYPQRNLCKHCRQKRIFFRERYVYMLRIILKSLKKTSYYALYELYYCTFILIASLLSRDETKRNFQTLVPLLHISCIKNWKLNNPK